MKLNERSLGDPDLVRNFYMTSEIVCLAQLGLG